MYKSRKVLVSGVLAMLLICQVSLANDSTVESSPDPRFEAHLLLNPRENPDALTRKFSYLEVGEYQVSDTLKSIILANGYAKASFSNTEMFDFDREQYRVTRISLVYTKYPLHKKDWLINYYDLLSWRLTALFELDITLNSSSIQWELISQTDGKTASAAKTLFHGIVLYLEPLETSMSENDLPSDRDGEKTFTPIENQGWLFKGERNPEMFRSRLIFEPEPGREPRRNMDPSDLKCPRWR